MSVDVLSAVLNLIQLLQDTCHSLAQTQPFQITHSSVITPLILL